MIVFSHVYVSDFTQIPNAVLLLIYTTWSLSGDQFIFSSFIQKSRVSKNIIP